MHFTFLYRFYLLFYSAQNEMSITATGVAGFFFLLLGKTGSESGKTTIFLVQ